MALYGQLHAASNDEQLMHSVEPVAEVEDRTQDGPMPTYVTLLNWTQQGIENVKDSPSRLDDAKEAAESMGGEITDWYLTFGQYDLVAVSEFPYDETAAQFALMIGSRGTVSSQTLKAFDEDQYREVIDGIPG